MHVSVLGRVWEWARRVGWVFIGVAVMALGVWVVVKARLAGTSDAFNRWTGWANVLALPVGGLGVALVAFEKAAAVRRTKLSDSSDSDMDRVLSGLARRLGQEWADEAVRREVMRPAPVLVSW